ncbi:MAG: hypothetical protein ABI597_14015 [Gammaproteobacteria bacterium]
MLPKRELSDEDILKLGRRVVEKTRNSLFLGSSNIQEDVLKTGGWVQVLIDSQRKKARWKKTGTKWGIKQVREANLTRQDLAVDHLGQHALYGAHALMSKSGNCGEMVDVAMYFLATFLSEHDLRKENITITSVELPDPYDHVLLKVAIHGEKTQNVYIDPWMDKVYLEKDYKENILLTIKKLSEELAVAPDAQDLEWKMIALQDQESIAKAMESSCLLPIEFLDSSNARDYYLKIFETECNYEATSDASAHFTDKLKEAVKNCDHTLMATYIAQGAQVTDEILKLAFLSGNAEVINKIQDAMLDQHDIKFMYFQHVFESLENILELEKRLLHAEQLSKEISSYQAVLEKREKYILTDAAASQVNRINKTFSALKNEALSGIATLKKYVESQNILIGRQIRTTKFITDVVSQYQNIFDQRQEKNQKKSFFTTQSHADRIHQIKYLCIMQHQIMISMQEPLKSKTRLNEQEGRLAIAGALWILKAQLNEKGQKGFLRLSKLETQIDTSLRALLPPGTSIKTPDPVSISLCIREMNRIPNSVLDEGLGSYEIASTHTKAGHPYWLKINGTAARLNNTLQSNIPNNAVDDKKHL